MRAGTRIVQLASMRVTTCLVWIVWLQTQHADAAVLVGVGGWIPAAVELARATGETEVQVEAGVYPIAGERLYLEVNQSIHLRGVGGVAVVDCGGQGSAIDIVLSTGMNVTFSDIAFRNCTSQATMGQPARTWSTVSWELGPIASWCSACWCGMPFCSKGGAVTISNAFANASGGPEVLNASVSFLRCDFIGNTADKGGAVAFLMFTNFSDSAFNFEDCRFIGNEATGSGGAAIDVMGDWAYNLLYYEQIYGDKNYHTTILNHVAFSLQRCSFEDNVGKYYGAVAFWSVAAIVANLNFSFSSSTFVGNQGGNGAGISLQVGRAEPDTMNTFLIDDVLFERNVARGSAVGGAVISTFPAAETNPNPPLPLRFREFSHTVRLITRNAVFKENHAKIGGAYCNGNGFHSMHNVSFLENSAVTVGGAICSNCLSGGDSRLVLEDVVFHGNSAHESASTFGAQSSGAISLRNCSFDLVGSTQGISDFTFSRAGEFHTDDQTSWRCRPNQRMLRTDSTVSWGDDANTNPAWNGESMDMKVSRMSLACLACPINQYTHLKSVLQGPVFVYINSSTNPDAVVQEQGRGTYAQQCLACPRGQFIENGACRSCPAGMSLTGDGIMTLESCQRNVQFATLQVILFLISTVGCLSVPILVGLPIPVKDVSLEQGKLVVTTCGQHHLLQQPWCQHQVRLRGTGHFLLDDKAAIFRVRVLDTVRLVLCDKSGAPVSERRDTSMGFLCINCRRAPLCMGFSHLPMAIIALLLVAAAVTIVVTEGMDAQGTIEVVALACLLSTTRVAWLRWTRQGPLAKRLTAFRKLTLADASKPHPCPRGPERAMSVSKLLDFYEYFQGYLQDRNMYYACANLIKPLTRPEKLSYAELVGPSRIQHFVSHFWGMQVRHLVESIVQHARQVSGKADWRDCTYWVCTFANSQWKLAEELPGTCEDSSFYLALRDRSCRGTAMLLDEEAEPLQRSWCLFELLQTFLLRKERLAQDFLGLSLCTSVGVLNSGGARVDVAMGIAKRLATLDLMHARATRVEDKTMIDDQVRSMEGGFPAMNRFLRTCVCEAMVTVKDHFENDFKDIVSALDDQRVEMCRTSSVCASAAATVSV